MPKFRVGDNVRFERNTLQRSAAGVFKITRVMPLDASDEYQYRLKSQAENHERVATESQLSSW
jgi:hypothetical protein